MSPGPCYGDEPEVAVRVAEKTLKLMEQQKKPHAKLRADIERALKRFRKVAGADL